MEDYEIRDVKNRRQIVSPLVNIDLEIDQVVVFLTISNIGTQTAEDLSFSLPKELDTWIEKEGPNCFTRGIKYLPPKRVFKIMYHAPIMELLGSTGPLPAQFDVAVTYKHPELNDLITEKFYFDLLDYFNTLEIDSELHQHGKKIKDSIDKLSATVRDLNRNVEKLTTVAGATGLNLSVSTVRNLFHILSEENTLEKINPFGLSYRVFLEVLGVNVNTALQLQYFFRRRVDGKKLEDVQGMTPELIDRLNTYFQIEGDE
jgi:hypothetical protein